MMEAKSAREVCTRVALSWAFWLDVICLVAAGYFYQLDGLPFTCAAILRMACCHRLFGDAQREQMPNGMQAKGSAGPLQMLLWLLLLCHLYTCVWFGANAYLLGRPPITQSQKLEQVYATALQDGFAVLLARPVVGSQPNHPLLTVLATVMGLVSIVFVSYIVAAMVSHQQRYPETDSFLSRRSVQPMWTQPACAQRQAVNEPDNVDFDLTEPLDCKLLFA